ncbi:epoxyqueuosine reductase QueH [Patescibacteria group bacterium]|nr:epoxyqueuosine reductase QueH [Patescibacteria group bacterium]MBU1673203.1 epoxyqueuosine reductase QueH [Patescibacteria group bacterium]MBU1963017.1 epoxyqueuosine reductase QueH [Patescibacteria group bacterium]
MKKMLVHVCCGPCGIYPLKTLEEQFNVTAFYFNPNIHPDEEYQKRLKAFQDYSDKYKIDYIVGDYNPDIYLEAVEEVAKEKDKRCPLCYELRLDYTAQEAKKRGFDAFTSTLLISPHQDIEMVKDLGDMIAGKYRLDFYDGRPEGDKKKFKGFRPGFTEGRKIAKQEKLYEQTYCGCLYSKRGL